VCKMFNQAISGNDPPKTLNSDNDPLFKSHRTHESLSAQFAAALNRCMRKSTTLPGGNIAEDYFKRPWQRKYQFAMHRMGMRKITSNQ